MGRWAQQARRGGGVPPVVVTPGILINAVTYTGSAFDFLVFTASPIDASMNVHASDMLIDGVPLVAILEDTADNFLAVAAGVPVGPVPWQVIGPTLDESPLQYPQSGMSA